MRGISEVGTLKIPDTCQQKKPLPEERAKNTYKQNRNNVAAGTNAKTRIPDYLCADVSSKHSKDAEEPSWYCD